MLAKYLPHYVRLSSGSAWVKTVRSEDGSLVRVLESGGVYQSATYLDERWAVPVFEYYKSFDAVFDVIPQAKHALMIGGGGYAWPKHVLAEYPDIELDVVELESAITKAAKRWFFLERAMQEYPGRLNLIEGDGRAFLDKGAPAKLYDAIVIDAFAGKEPVRALATLEAANSAKCCLVSNGVLVANVVSEDEGVNVAFLQSLVATWREIFAYVYVVACEEDSFALEDNYLVLASDGDFEVPGAIPYENDFLGEVLTD